ncbi:MAG TPA: DUF2277 domain-containing protein [Bryobacteraceae bacterium]|nr:DUF2277 domain-containing protein [Bryobacteraceae bacterium]
MATPEELHGAALQFVRKISGFHKPSKANQQVFEQAVREITEASARLLEAIQSVSPVATPPSDQSAPRAEQVANMPTLPR